VNNKKDPRTGRTLLFYVMIFLGIIALVSSFRGMGSQNAQRTEVEFSQFIELLNDSKVSEVYISESGRYYNATLKDGSLIVSYAPTSYDMAIVSQDFIYPQLAKGTLKVESIQPSILSGLLGWLPTLLMFGFLIFFYSRMMGGGGNRGVMNFGKSRAVMQRDGDKRVTFADVAGLEEEKQELSEIVDFLKNPKKYLELGARIPKGVLLVGPPGTGKTYISKAVAGEAGVPFFSISGSDFVEMFVGVGASRVRDLFADAKKNAPCIVFIDEIDAVGRRRGAGIGGGNDEREQTLNQLLVEMDGFGVNEGIIILAATNRPDVLDPAILRPGRFDREVTISAPDVKGREAVFQLYAKGKPIDKNVDLKVLAKRTPGFTPADIENMMNEAALLTARRNGTIIHMDDLEEAITRVIAGPKKKSRVMSDKEKRLTAFHEAGHAVVSRCIPGYDPVHQVTIMPRGRAGGFTMNLGEEDRYYATRGDMLDEIAVLLGGRVAESLRLDDISTGASNDLERATKVAHDMVTKYGMSEAIGPVNYSDADEVFLGRDFTSKQNFSEDLASRIDKEVRRILDEQYERTKAILAEHDAQLEAVADALLEMETIDGEQFEAIFTGTKGVEELKAEQDLENKARERKEKIEAQARAEREAREAEEAERAAIQNAAALQKAQAPKATRIAVIGSDGKPVIRELGRDGKIIEPPEPETSQALPESAEAPAEAPEAPAEAAEPEAIAEPSEAPEFTGPAENTVPESEPAPAGEAEDSGSAPAEKSETQDHKQ
jgi:cell division protease FtsH